MVRLPTLVMHGLLAISHHHTAACLRLIFAASVQVPFTFGIEIFEAGHKTSPHSHSVAHELFFILAGMCMPWAG